jgi:N-sulfoglucosamine sulfohydrolase
LVRGETERLHEAIFSEQTFHAAEDQMRCVRTDRYKYIRFYQDGTRAILPNVDNSPTKTLQHDAGVLTKPRAKEMLFDLMYDPHEFHNLISDSDYEDVRKDLAGRLERWMRETEDPLLKGLVSLPDGARVTPRTKYDPRLPE